MIDRQKVLRLIAVLSMALTVAQCGDGGGGNDNDSDVGSPSPGTFAGGLEDGGTITLKVGSIDAVRFDCDDLQIQESFSPPQPVDADGKFDVKFTDGGRRFEVRGTFTDDDHAEGTIDDHDNHCDTSFSATRGDLPLPTPTVVLTPTATGPVTTIDTPTETPTDTPTGGPTETPTSTSSGPINTGATKTATLTPTPTPTNTNEPPRCPAAIEVIGTAGAAKVLDTGWTGITHNQTVIQDGKLSFTVSGCDSPVRPCGVCDVGGPIQNANADHGDINAHRCSNDTTIKCEDNTACASPGTCVFFFGAPLPISAGGAPTCVTNQINGAVSGTANIETGVFASSLDLTSLVFSGIQNDLPCPVCQGDPTVNDGTKGGTCSGGPKNGQACDGNGRSPVPSFGTTSLDCPPNPSARIASLPIALHGSSGTETMTLAASSPGCTDAAGKKCFCPGQSTRPNACIDGTEIEGDGTLCAADSQTEGHCTEGPTDQNCVIESFRGCLKDSECPAQGDSCGSAPRPCYLDNGAVGGSIVAVGMADVPSNGEADPTLAALFCVGNTSSASVNTVAGLPGVGRIELPLHTKQLTASP